jgi:hypothetical protein
MLVRVRTSVYALIRFSSSSETAARDLNGCRGRISVGFEHRPVTINSYCSI